ncbi:MAG: hypothetical protein Ct9H300mP25_05510 [Acidobacteriota bacterium]|nr:MAG: hypothetical protein Ct9H300mP25_05510 [Acidobacteriota bacterium]
MTLDSPTGVIFSLTRLFLAEGGHLTDPAAFCNTAQCVNADNGRRTQISNLDSWQLTRP